MKWYDKVGVAKCGLLASILFLLLSYSTRTWEWWPELFLIMAEAASSVAIVIWVIEGSIGREKERQWMNVKNSIYTQILFKLRAIVLATTHYRDALVFKDIMYLVNLVKYTENPTEDELSGVSSAIRRYSNSIRDDCSEIIIAPDQFRNFNHDVYWKKLKILAILDRIIPEIDEYRSTLIPRTLEMADPEVNFALLQFDEQCTRIYRINDILRRAEHSKKENDIGEFTSIYTVHEFSQALPVFLDQIANLYELVQRKTIDIQERGMIEDSLQGLKQKFLMGSKITNVAAVILQIAAFLVCFVLPLYAMATIFMRHGSH